MKILQDWRFDGNNVNWKWKDLLDMFEMVSFHTDTDLKPHSPLIDGPVNDCLPKVWPYINQVLCQLVDVACALLLNAVSKTDPNFVIDKHTQGPISMSFDHFCVRSGLLGGQRLGEMKSNTRRCYVHDGQERWISTELALWEYTGCHDNSCSWYSDVWIIFMVKYQVMLQEQFDHWYCRCLWKLLP